MSDIASALRDILNQEFDVDRAAITDDTTLQDLGVNSVAAIELIDIIKEKLGIAASDDEMTTGHTINQLVEILSAKDSQ